ncbi:hypothetical protein PR048_025598 [Dryococelus australis]|uniref:Uncharacterized protein n=1 Tax=Dryococelus australis TaxID=614101 RepID=A0ABQ9GRU2_9NEOP|nr:hypothetical protein PR048_025598 [Dryococelus australis]
MCLHHCCLIHKYQKWLPHTRLQTTRLSCQTHFLPNNSQVVPFTFKFPGPRISNGCMSNQMLMELHASIAI